MLVFEHQTGISPKASLLLVRGGLESKYVRRPLLPLLLLVRPSLGPFLWLSIITVGIVVHLRLLTGVFLLLELLRLCSFRVRYTGIVRVSFLM